MNRGVRAQGLGHLDFSAQHYHFGWHHGELRVEDGREDALFQADAADFINIDVVVHLSGLHSRWFV